MVENIVKDQINTFTCKYHDEKSFNELIQDKKCSLSLIHANLQSSFKNFALFKANLLNLNHTFPIIAISETGTSKIDVLHNYFDGYSFEYKLPVNNKKGGVGVYFKHGCSFSKRVDLEFNPELSIEDIWFEINNSYILGIIYRNPNNSVELFVTLLEETILKIKRERKPFIICGEINIDLLRIDNPKCQQYLDTLFSNNIIPTITLPTRITDYTSTIIDHIIIYRPLNQLNNHIFSGNLFIDVSDHLPNFVFIEGKSNKFNQPLNRFNQNLSNL